MSVITLNVPAFEEDMFSYTGILIEPYEFLSNETHNLGKHICLFFSKPLVYLDKKEGH